jgi:hypothetical protein
VRVCVCVFYSHNTLMFPWIGFQQEFKLLQEISLTNWSSWPENSVTVSDRSGAFASSLRGYSMRQLVSLGLCYVVSCGIMHLIFNATHTQTHTHTRAHTNTHTHAHRTFCSCRPSARAEARSLRSRSECLIFFPFVSLFCRNILPFLVNRFTIIFNLILFKTHANTTFTIG